MAGKKRIKIADPIKSVYYPPPVCKVCGNTYDCMVLTSKGLKCYGCIEANKRARHVEDNSMTKTKEGKAPGKVKEKKAVMWTEWINFPNSPKIAEALSIVMTAYKVKKEAIMLKALEAFFTVKPRSKKAGK